MKIYTIKTVATLQAELDELHKTDEFICKLCKVKLKGDSIDEHLGLFAALPPYVKPSYDMAGEIRLRNYPYPVIYVRPYDAHHVEFHDPIRKCAVTRHRNDIILNISYLNLDYYNANLQCCKTELNQARYHLNELKGGSEIQISEAQTNVDWWTEQASLALDYAAGCRYYDHIESRTHVLYSEELLEHRNGIEATGLELVVKAILLNRRVADQLNRETTTTTTTTTSVVEEAEVDESTRDELELKYSEVEQESITLRKDLKRCRETKTYKNQTTIKMITEKINKLKQLVEELEVALKQALESQIMNSEESNKLRGGENIELQETKNAESGMFGEDAEEQDEDFMEGFQPSKIDQKKRNAKKKKIEKTISSPPTSASEPNSQPGKKKYNHNRNVKGRGSLANSKHSSSSK
jgi:hypothetical protein